MLLHPTKETFAHLDPASREILRKTIAFFENRGKRRLKQDDYEHLWYTEFLAFVRQEQVFATFLTPAAYGGGNPDVRWDTRRICAMNEVLGFYGLPYWYTWQVTILGLGPIWMGDNEEVKVEVAQLLCQGAVFAFGLSEQAHGADLYASEMALIPAPGGGYVANGRKYYIGNGNQAARVSTFGKRTDTGEYVFFAVDSQHPAYDCVRNLVNSQNYVAEFALRDYPVRDADILATGEAAWNATLNTVNVGKFNLGW
ncbi:MAG: acyl-CoA/acyl-ACP dehydrogenase, partial [Deferrisomatales bacterium]|nr:acyl-CoA/acyl-ACP dehydrogenase [Deferrisomatales bacterium]